jgi:aspartate carbamoyltransferase catalytic subunit
LNQVRSGLAVRMAVLYLVGTRRDVPAEEKGK